MSQTRDYKYSLVMSLATMTTPEGGDGIAEQDLCLAVVKQEADTDDPSLPDITYIKEKPFNYNEISTDDQAPWSTDDSMSPPVEASFVATLALKMEPDAEDFLGSLQAATAIPQDPFRLAKDAKRESPMPEVRPHQRPDCSRRFACVSNHKDTYEKAAAKCRKLKNRDPVSQTTDGSDGPSRKRRRGKEMVTRESSPNSSGSEGAPIISLTPSATYLSSRHRPPSRRQTQPPFKQFPRHAPHPAQSRTRLPTPNPTVPRSRIPTPCRTSPGRRQMAATQEPCPNCIHSSSTNDRIFEELKDLRRQVGQVADQVGQVLELLLQQQPHAAQVAAGPTAEELQFPMGTLQDLMGLNTLLLDKYAMRKRVNFLGSLGGRDAKVIVRRILSTMISDNLAQQLNWIGRDKTSIRDFKQILLLITFSTRINFVTQDYTQNMVEGIIKPWLRGASDRNGGRLQRESRAARLGVHRREPEVEKGEREDSRKWKYGA